MAGKNYLASNNMHDEWIKAFDEADDSIGVQEVVNMMRKWEDPT